MTEKTGLENNIEQFFITKIIESGYLKEWRYFRDIRLELRKMNIDIDHRAFTRLKDAINALYLQDKYPYYIAHSQSGYKASKNKDDLIMTAKDYEKGALIMFKKSRNIKKHLITLDVERLL